MIEIILGLSVAVMILLASTTFYIKKSAKTKEQLKQKQTQADRMREIHEKATSVRSDKSERDELLAKYRRPGKSRDT